MSGFPRSMFPAGPCGPRGLGALCFLVSSSFFANKACCMWPTGFEAAGQMQDGVALYPSLMHLCMYK